MKQLVIKNCVQRFQALVLCGSIIKVLQVLDHHVMFHPMGQNLSD